jgi:cbb3-type cytochrome oxidase cytochrome c subunit
VTEHEPSVDSPQETRPGHDVPRWMRVLERASTVMLLGGVGSLVVSFLALGVLPLIGLADETTRYTPAAYRPMSTLESVGFAVYKREGCASCHSTFVRDTASDVRRFGPPAEAWEFADQYPQQWGTRRVGPDLSRESGLRTPDWQLAHLYDPRSTVPESIMPGYPWLFVAGPGGQPVPTDEARGLVAYLDYLGRAMADAGPQTERGRSAVGGEYGHEEHTDG